ncbi:hypothetical protein MJT46_006195 [Ovis ammon polii x Ovis aries]|nr:hypothetical protein MJT46_006195 [Ovis ammon polii x Ovis aries]
MVFYTFAMRENAVPDHSGGRLSAIPSPFFTSQSVHQGISPTTAHSSSLCVSSHITTNSKLHPPKHKRQSGIFMYRNEMQVEKQSNSEVLFVDVNVCVYVCLFNITAFEILFGAQVNFNNSLDLTQDQTLEPLLPLSPHSIRGAAPSSYGPTQYAVACQHCQTCDPSFYPNDANEAALLQLLNA